MAARKKPTNPDEAALRELGLGFPETTEDFPWDHRALKVRGKVFAFMGTGSEGGASHDDFFITCKLPHSAAMALLDPRVKPTGYGLGKSGWVSARYPPGKAPLDMLKDWLRESYQAVAPKTLAALVDSGAATKTKKTAAKTKKTAPKTKKTAAKTKKTAAKTKKTAAKTKKTAAKTKKR